MPVETASCIRMTLSRSMLFKDLAPSTIEMLTASARLRRLHTGNMIVHRGDRPAGMFAVAKGEVKLLLMSSSGAERIVRLVRPGDTFCEESILGDMPQTLAAQVTAPTLLIHIAERAMQQALAADPRLALALAVSLSARIYALVADIELCEQRNSAQRVAHYLVKHARHVPDAIEVKLSSNKQTIASQLNMTPESLSRVLNRFTREGFILRHGHRAILLTDLSGLQSLAA